MLQIIYGQDLRVGTWVMERIGQVFTRDDSVTIGLEKDGEIVAGFVYNNYRIKSICIHSAGSLYTKEFIKVGFNYPFKQLKVQQTVHLIDSTNTKSIDITTRLGAKYIATIPNASIEGDLLIYTMQQQDFKFKD